MRQLKSFYFFLKNIFQLRNIIRSLVIRDFQNKYLGSYLGLPWVFIQSAASVLVIWFAVSFGLKAGMLETGVDFGLFLVLGMVPFIFLSDSIINGTNSVLELSYLIKNISFSAGLLPLIKIITALIIHFFFLIILIILTISYGYYPSVYWIQIPYFLFASLFLTVGISWLTSSINVFFRDIGQFIGVVMNILFWATPIIWHQSILKGNMILIAKLNPFFYIVDGYRNAFLSEKWFFESINQTLYFWCITLFLFFCGAWVFRRLKPHFTDVL